MCASGENCPSRDASLHIVTLPGARQGDTKHAFQLRSFFLFLETHYSHHGHLHDLSNLYYLPSVPTPESISVRIWGRGFQHVNLGRHSQTIAVALVHSSAWQLQAQLV
jgi:hypothetical protein